MSAPAEPTTDAPTDSDDLGALRAAPAPRARRVSAAELVEGVLARIDARNGGPPSFDGSADAVNAWARIYPDEARAAARAADERLPAAGGDPPRASGGA